MFFKSLLFKSLLFKSLFFKSLFFFTLLIGFPERITAFVIAAQVEMGPFVFLAAAEGSKCEQCGDKERELHLIGQGSVECSAV